MRENRGGEKLLKTARETRQVRVDVRELNADLLTVVGHKFGAPKGIAALYIRDGVHLARFLHGGGQVRELFETDALSGSNPAKLRTSQFWNLNGLFGPCELRASQSALSWLSPGLLPYLS